MAAIPAHGLRLLGQLFKRAGTAEGVRAIDKVVVTGAQAESRCDNEENTADCNQCKLTEGLLAPPKARRNISDNNLVNYQYQIYIANLHAAPERFGLCLNGTDELLTELDFSVFASLKRFVLGGTPLKPENMNILEWQYNGVDFDGFWRQKCTVVDAKGKYAKHIDSEGKPRRGFPREVMFPAFEKELNRQKTAIEHAHPQAKIEWHFMEP
ncbi:Tox-REase-5 domain-containing protein [Pseudomonas agarici]|uniref:Tox-REase-5 domain-containing protein n=3 Tax=Pseudomonas agarici TaxID=46677 RepID=UPI0002FB1275|nr:Tox-REase-5 domain-containing protein [Pseudomonas agarici]